MNVFAIPRLTGTHADALAAIGAADVLRHLEPHVREFDDRFEIRLGKELTPADLDSVAPGFSYLDLPTKKRADLPPERVVRADEESRMYSILRRMKAYGGPNKVVSQFARMSRGEWKRRVAEGFEGRSDFIFTSPLVQLFHPHAAKGYAMLKPAGTHRRDKTKDRWAEPFSDWLRFRGYFEGASGWFTDGDLRLYCPIPSDIDYDRFAAVATSLRDLNLGGTAVKMDCRAMLAVARMLVESSARRPAQSIGGMWVTHYKDMGQAHTVMGMDRLAVPDWFEVPDEEHRHLWVAALEEHDRAVRRLNDTHSDEFALLKQYRRTFQSNPAGARAEFVEFLAGYGALLFRRRSQDQWTLPQFHASPVALVLARDPAICEMLHHPGFLAVAAAVRSSTVGAQAMRYNGIPEHREIRYGLLVLSCIN